MNRFLHIFTIFKTLFGFGFLARDEEYYLISYVWVCVFLRRLIVFFNTSVFFFLRLFEFCFCRLATLLTRAL